MCDLDTYRRRIGSVHVREKMKQDKFEIEGILRSFFLGVICAILLIIGGIEVNPGPRSNNEQDDVTQQQINEIITNIVDINNEIAAIKTYMGNKISRLEDSVKELRKELSMMEQSSQKTETNFMDADRELRINNLIIFGIKEEQQERKHQTGLKTLEFIRSQLKINIHETQLRNCYRIGKNSPRAIIAKFDCYLTKERILSNRNLLKNTNYRLDNDFSETVRDTRRSLLPFMLSARKLGHRANLSYDKIIIDGQRLSLQDCRNRFENNSTLINIEKRKTHSKHGTVIDEHKQGVSKETEQCVHDQFDKVSKKLNENIPTGKSEHSDDMENTIDMNHKLLVNLYEMIKNIDSKQEGDNDKQQSSPGSSPKSNSSSPAEVSINGNPHSSKSTSRTTSENGGLCKAKHDLDKKWTPVRYKINVKEGDKVCSVVSKASSLQSDLTGKFRQTHKYDLRKYYPPKGKY